MTAILRSIILLSDFVIVNCANTVPPEMAQVIDADVARVHPDNVSRQRDVLSHFACTQATADDDPDCTYGQWTYVYSVVESETKLVTVVELRHALQWTVEYMPMMRSLSRVVDDSAIVEPVVREIARILKASTPEVWLFCVCSVFVGLVRVQRSVGRHRAHSQISVKTRDYVTTLRLGRSCLHYLLTSCSLKMPQRFGNRCWMPMTMCVTVLATNFFFSLFSAKRCLFCLFLCNCRTQAVLWRIFSLHWSRSALRR